MRSIFTFIIALFILTACSQTSISGTPTPLPSKTPTRIPTVTPTLSPAFTSTPELTAEQKAWKESVAPIGFEKRADGSVWDLKTDKAVTGIDWKAGTFTEQYEDQTLVIPIMPDILRPILDAAGSPLAGLDLFELGFTWNGSELVRKEYKGEQLFNKYEVQAFLSNPENVDLSITEFNFDVLVRQFSSVGQDRPIFHYNKIAEPKNKYSWADDIAPIEDKNAPGGYQANKTTPYSMGELENVPVSMVFYTAKDDGITSLEDRVRVKFLDSGNYVYGDDDPNLAEHFAHPIEWSEYYADHEVRWH